MSAVSSEGLCAIQALEDFIFRLYRIIPISVIQKIYHAQFSAMFFFSFFIPKIYCTHFFELIQCHHQNVDCMILVSFRVNFIV